MGWSEKVKVVNKNGNPIDTATATDNGKNPSTGIANGTSVTFSYPSPKDGNIICNVQDPNGDGAASITIQPGVQGYQTASNYPLSLASDGSGITPGTVPQPCILPTQSATPPPSCIIASACLGEDARDVAGLRKIRDAAISSDPVARDFFHVFWSRYYEWSPGVARIANADKAVAEHIRWGFLDPWMSWIEFVAILGQRSIADLSEAERNDLLERLGARRTEWLAELPALLEEKRPADDREVFQAFERFRAAARTVFDATDHQEGDAGMGGATGAGDGRRSS